MSEYTWRELERADMDAAAAHAFEIEHRAEQGIMSDEINAPRHYTGNGIECLDAMRSAMHDAPITGYQSFLWGAAFKYIWRWPFKNGNQDLRKARRCIDYLLDEDDTCHIIEYEDAPYLVCSKCGAIQPEDHEVRYCWACGSMVVK